jgi:hypothetical protein
VAFALAWLLEEVPLRDTLQADTDPVAETVHTGTVAA